MEMSSSRRVMWLLAGQLAAYGAFAVAGSIVFGLPAWLLLRFEANQLAILCVAYALSSVLPLAFALKRTTFPGWLVILITAGLFAASRYGSVYVDAGIPLARAEALGIVAVCLNLLLLWASHPGRARKLRSSAYALTGVCALGALLAIAPLRHTSLAEGVFRNLVQPVSREVQTALHRVRIHFFRARIPTSQSQGGGLELAGDKLLLMTGDGLFYLLTLSGDSERLEVRPLDRTVPVNRQAFLESPLGPVEIRDFRALAVLLPNTSLPGAPPAAPQRILVSHHYWYAEKKCFVVRVSVLDMQWQEFVEGHDPAAWHTLYETTPCLHLEPGVQEEFSGNQSGGQMIQISPDTILLTVGDHGHNGVYAQPAVSQLPDYSYGKTITININSGANQVFTLGHRNPQGLYQDNQGRIWETEHGPKGGDEINRIDQGKNYGWPLVTLGADYFHYSWPEIGNLQPGTELTTPLFAWTPSIGVTALTQVEGGDFIRWQGDFLVASLVGKSVFRVHLIDGRPMMAEPIRMRERIRDIVRDASGRIVFWTDRGDVGVLNTAAEPDIEPDTDSAKD